MTIFAEQNCADFIDRSEWARMRAAHSALEIEVGCGRGDFLMALAERYPDTLFLGIDRADRWHNRNGRYWAGREKPSNVLFVRFEAKTFLESVIPASCFFTRIERVS